MENTKSKKLFDLKLTQIAWVVKDINAAEKFFREVMGIGHFLKMENYSVACNYYGKPVTYEGHVCLAYSGETFIELIQPVSGQSVFHDYLERNPDGGMQHVAYSLPIADFDKAVSEITGKGYPIISTFDTPIAKIVFFDTYKELGILTELMGITHEGEEQVQSMRESLR
jgi:methylmalonyl-CoA/ethylmalonyl-CoA epimerase